MEWICPCMRSHRQTWLTLKVRELWGIDPRSLAFFRIGLGVMLISDLVKRSMSFREHYTSEGIFPLEAAKGLEPDSILFQIYLISDSFHFQAFLFLIAAVLAVLLILGYRTRLVTLLSLVFVVSLVRRNPYATHTGDVLLQAMTFWALFLPLGSVFSLDRKQGRTKPLEGHVVSVGTVAVLLQLAAFYVFAGILKHHHDVWMRGDALWVFTNIEEYTRGFGLLLRDYPGLCKVLTYCTLALEVGGPIFLFFPWFTGPIRTVTVFLFAGFHLGIQLTVYIGIFEVLSIVCVCLFLPAWFWDRLSLFLPGAWVAPRDALRTRLLHCGSAPSPVAGPPSLGQRVGSRFGQVFCGTALILMLFGNWNNPREKPFKLPSLIEDYGKQLALQQNWNIFSDIENTFYGWFLVLGQLEDGRIVNVLEDRGFDGVSRPAHFARSFPNHNTRRFWRLMSRTPNAWLRVYVGSYLVDEWNRTHADKLKRIAAYHVGNEPGRGEGHQRLVPLFHYPTEPIDPRTLPQQERADFNAKREAWKRTLLGVPQRLQVSDDGGIELVHRLEESMGGREAWNRLRHISWVYPGPRKHTWDKASDDVRIEAEGLLILMNVGTRAGRAYQNGVLVKDPVRLRELLDQGYRWWVNDSYWLVMPWKLLDPGVAVRYRGEGKFADGRTSDLLSVLFNGVGTTPRNRYLLALDRETGLVEQWSFFRDLRDNSPVFTRPWSEWRAYDGVLLATDKGNRHDWQIKTFRELPSEVYSGP